MNLYSSRLLVVWHEKILVKWFTLCLLCALIGNRQNFAYTTVRNWSLYYSSVLSTVCNSSFAVIIQTVLLIVRDILLTCFIAELLMMW